MNVRRACVWVGGRGQKSQRRLWGCSVLGWELGGPRARAQEAGGTASVTGFVAALEGRPLPRGEKCPAPRKGNTPQQVQRWPAARLAMQMPGEGTLASQTRWRRLQTTGCSVPVTHARRDDRGYFRLLGRPRRGNGESERHSLQGGFPARRPCSPCDVPEPSSDNPHLKSWSEVLSPSGREALGGRLCAGERGDGVRR